MRNLVLITFIFYTSISCNRNNYSDKIIKTPSFSIAIPYNWSYLLQKGIDSETGIFITEKSDTIFYDFGHYSDPLNEQYLVLDYRRKNDVDTLNFDIPVYFSNDAESDLKSGKFSNQLVFKDSIDNLLVKIVRPKKRGKGIAGAYFDNISNNNKLTIHATNLDSLTEEKLIKAIYTIRF